MKFPVSLWLLCLLIVLGSASCSVDEAGSPEFPELDEEPVRDDPQNTGDPDDYPQVGAVEFLNPALVDERYIPVNVAGANDAYFMNKKGALRHE